MCAYFVDKSFSISAECTHFPTFSANAMNAEFEQRDGHGKLRMVMETSLKITFVGTLECKHQ